MKNYINPNGIQINKDQYGITLTYQISSDEAFEESFLTEKEVLKHFGAASLADLEACHLLQKMLCYDLEDFTAL